MNDLPIDDSILEDWLGGPVPEEKLKEIRESTHLNTQKTIQCTKTDSSQSSQQQNSHS
jgi:hypothetical protein